MKFGHLLFSVVAASSSSVVLAAPGACHFAKYGICIESSTIDLEADCKDSASQGAVFIAKCPTDNRFASCKVVEDNEAIFARYYKGFTVERAKKHCSENKGEYAQD